MAWLQNRDGLKLAGDPHYDFDQIRGLIAELRQSGRGQPGTVCTLLDGLLSTGQASKELVWRLSKWCHWRDRSARTARAIAGRLFNGIVCRRLRDQRNRPIPDLATAEADYQRWLHDVIEISHGRLPNSIFPDEIEEPDGTYMEGAMSRRLVNAYERNLEARRRCIDHYGPKCFVCGFDFARTYDGIGEGLIHVHHLRKISEIGDEHEINPITDMRPVCANCHVVIHRYREPFSIEEVRAMLTCSRGKARQLRVYPDVYIARLAV